MIGRVDNGPIHVPDTKHHGHFASTIDVRPVSYGLSETTWIVQRETLWCGKKPSTSSAAKGIPFHLLLHPPLHEIVLPDYREHGRRASAQGKIVGKGIILLYSSLTSGCLGAQAPLSVNCRRSAGMTYAFINAAINSFIVELVFILSDIEHVIKGFKVCHRSLYFFQS